MVLEKPFKSYSRDNSLLSYEQIKQMNYQKTQVNHPSLPFKFNTFFQPGIYAIVNKVTKKIYIGETSNLSFRLSQHYSQLKSKNHTTKALQLDWNKYGENFFDLKILELGLIWKDRLVRLQKERFYILQHKDACYNHSTKCLNNFLTKTKKTFKKVVYVNSISVNIDGNHFESISEASRFLKVSLSTIRLKLNSDKYPTWNYINEKKRLRLPMSKPVVINNFYYLSVNSAASKLGISEKTVRKTIKKQPDWHFFADLSKRQKQAISNLDEQIVVAKAKSYILGRRVRVKNHIFASIRQTASLFSIDSHTVRKRINSSNFPEWLWADDR